MNVMIEYDNTFLGGKEHPMIDFNNIISPNSQNTPKSH